MSFIFKNGYETFIVQMAPQEMTPILRTPCTISPPFAPIITNRSVCEQFTAVLQERLTFTFRGENFTHSTVSECRMSRGNVHLTVSVVSDLTATVTECTDGTALCVQVLNVLHCCVLQVTVTHKAWQCVQITSCAEGQCSTSCSVSYFRSYQ